MSEKADISIIADIKSVNIKKTKKYLKIFQYSLKKIYYTLIFNKKKKLKYKKLLKQLLCNKYYLVGHEALQLSLHRGFESLKIPYDFNKITEHTKYLILLWIDEKDLQLIEQYKRKYNIQKVVTVPTACKYDYSLMYRFANFDCIDYDLCASERVALECRDKVEREYEHKIVAWPSGVELQNKRDKLYNKCIIYIKDIKAAPCLFDNRIFDLLQDMNIEYTTFNYGYYDYIQWQKALKSSDFVIFYQNGPETQGLAMAEAWANDCPTIIKTKYKNPIKGTSPYLTDKSGLYFENFDELLAIITEYKNNPEKFINKFSPYEYVKENLSDEVSVMKLINLLEN